MSAFERLGITDQSMDRDVSSSQKQTDEAFGFKWSKRDTYESDAFQANVRRWLLERYCGNDPKKLAGWLSGGG
jgi:arsenite methyltransferase